ncbi:NUMB phenylalanine-rich region, partial [Teladorsagia circumcincta]
GWQAKLRILYDDKNNNSNICNHCESSYTHFTRATTVRKQSRMHGVSKKVEQAQEKLDPQSAIVNNAPLTSAHHSSSSIAKPRPSPNPALFQRQGQNNYGLHGDVESLSPGSLRAPESSSAAQFRRNYSLRTNALSLDGHPAVYGKQSLHNEPIYEGEEESSGQQAAHFAPTTTFGEDSGILFATKTITDSLGIGAVSLISPMMDGQVASANGVHNWQAAHETSNYSLFDATVASGPPPAHPPPPLPTKDVVVHGSLASGPGPGPALDVFGQSIQWDPVPMTSATPASRDDAALMAGCGQNPDYNKKLEDALLKDYNSRHRPVKSESTTVQVSVYMGISHVEKVDEHEQTMLVHGHLWATWIDEYLVWTPKDYNDTTKINIDSWRIWQPALALYNRVIPPLNRLDVVTKKRYECPIVIADWVYDLSRVNLSDPQGSTPFNKPTIRLNYDPTGQNEKKHVAGVEIALENEDSCTKWTTSDEK